jgi:hypothetical protein
MDTLFYNLESRNCKSYNDHFNKHFTSLQLLTDFNDFSKMPVYNHICEITHFLHDNYLINHDLINKHKKELDTQKTLINKNIEKKYLRDKNTFFPVEIREYIRDNAFYFVNERVNIQNRNFNIELYYFSYRDYIKFKGDLIRIVSWLTYIAPLASEQCSINTDIKFFFTPLMKLFPLNNQPDESEYKIQILNATNVNSAFTYTCMKNNEIIIYRKEEWFKVFIHETFHTFGMDFSNTPIDMFNSKIKKIIPVQSDFLIYESYCEFFATFFNIVYSLIEKPKFSLQTSQDCSNLISEILCKIHNQNRFSIYQMIKIMDYYEIDLKDLLKNTNKDSYLRYKEDTNILAYYYIKTVLFINFEDFYSWCLNNNNQFIKFNNEKNNIDKFYNFIISRWSKLIYNPTFEQMDTLFKYDKLIYLQMLDKSIFIRKRKKAKQTKEMLPFFLTNLRMTLY